MNKCTSEICEFCHKSIIFCKYNKWHQFCCSSEECKKKLKARHQKKILEDGYWKGYPTSQIQHDYRQKKRLKTKNIEIEKLFKDTCTAVKRVLEKGGKKLSEIIELFASQVDSNLRNALHTVLDVIIEAQELI